MVVKPTGVLPRHTLCFERLAEMVALLRTGDEVVDKLTELHRLIHEHHILFLEVYGDCAKPKLHYLRHCFRNILDFKKNLNCFATERKHKDPR